ncbi:MAG: O-methyltransferase [Halobacteriota archaeon]
MVLVDDVARFVRAVGPDHDQIQREMAAFADDNGFPIIGPDAGGVLRLLARLTEASSVFEFGSGFGYSAYWFLRGMEESGRVVLTEFDVDELDKGREFFERAGVTSRATFEAGDAVEIVDRYDGPFDVVLIDHQKHRYAEAFEKVREKVRPGGVVVADNVMRGPIDFDALLAHVEGDGLADVDEDTRGVATYLDSVGAAENFETLLLPVGSGICISTRVE